MILHNTTPLVIVLMLIQAKIKDKKTHSLNNKPQIIRILKVNKLIIMIKGKNQRDNNRIKTTNWLLIL